MGGHRGKEEREFLPFSGFQATGVDSRSCGYAGWDQEGFPEEVTEAWRDSV